MGHLGGARVSALLDGQLGAGEAEQAWVHVYSCETCRLHVEREGWVKARLAGLSGGHGVAPDHLRGTLYGLPPDGRHAVAPRPGAQDRGGVAGVRGARPAPAGQGRRTAAVVGTGAVGAAMLGVLALGIAPASKPPERRPTGGVTQPVSTVVPHAPVGPVAVAATGIPAAASSAVPSSSTAAPTNASTPTGPTTR